MSSMEKSKVARFVTFCLIGATSSAIDISLLWVGVSILNLNLFLAATLSFGVASVNAYVLNHKITFKSGPTSFTKYLQFLIVSVIGLLLTLILLHIFTEYLNMYYLFAKIITVVLVVFWNYFANVLWTFKQTPPADMLQ